MVVTATRHAISEIEAPAAMSVVTRRDLEQRGADNLLEAIRGEVGISLQGRAIGGRQVLSIRGLDSRHTLFVVDGRRIAASDGVIGHSDFQYDWIAVEDIERIEVARGPLSVLYGSEALGGVINVITRQPGDRWAFGAVAEGSWAEGGRGGDGHRVAARADGPLAEGLTLRAGAGQSARSAIASVEDPRISELEGREKRDGWLGLGWRPRDGQRVDAEYRQGHEERVADARERTGARRYHETVNLIDRTLASLNWEADWGGAAALGTQFRAYRSTLDVENRRTAGVAANPPQRQEDEVLEGQARFLASAHALTTGFEARNEALEDPGLPGARSIAQHRALFVQDEFRLAGTVAMTLGLRHDQHSLFGSETSPRIYAVWQADPAWTLKGGYSHGFKAPNLKQIVPGARREGPNIFLGNPDLQPETSDSVEFGVGWRQAGFAVQAMAFDQRVDELIEVKQLVAGPAPGTGTYTYVNLSSARLRGVETGVSGPLGAGFALTLNYTYLDARSDSGQRLDKRARHSAALRLDWQHGPWRAGVSSETTADQLLPAAVAGQPSKPAPDITLVGAYLIRTLDHGLELNLGVDNLTNVRLADESLLFQQVEPPRTWRIALRGRW